MKRIKNHGYRKDLRDIWWNAFMVKGCIKWENDIPFCPTNKIEIPNDLIHWKDAVTLYNKMIKKDKNFKSDSYVCFYIDDYKFDGINGIWFNYNKAIEILKHFAGIISPDFSTYADFPVHLKNWNTYRMRAFGYWIASQGINVINNVRWSPDSLDVCFSGIPKNSIVCLGAVASGLKKKENRAEYEYYLKEMVRNLKPKIILIYGSANYTFFKDLQKQGIVVKSYQTVRNTRKASAGDAL